MHMQVENLLKVPHRKLFHPQLNLNLKEIALKFLLCHITHFSWPLVIHLWDRKIAELYYNRTFKIYFLGKLCSLLLLASVVSDSVQPHRQQPTRLLCPWDSPGKNTEVGCHFLFQCMKVKSESEVSQSCPTLHDPMDCSLLGSPIHGIFQARVLEWVAIDFSSLPQ